MRTFFLFAVLSIVLQGCSIFGKTKSFTLAVADTPQQQQFKIEPVQLAFLEDQSKQIAIASYSIGAFNEKDSERLKKSLEATIANFRDPNAPEQLKLVTILRNYLLTTSNTEGSILSCVAWALVNEQGVVYEEQFYVADHFRMIPLGKAKNLISKNIVERIATVSHKITSKQADQIANVKVDNIYFDYDQAIAKLPSVLSSHYSLLTFGPGYTLLTSSAFQGGVDLSQNEEQDKIDWTPYLK